MTEQVKIHQPIHPSIRASLDPEYVSFHDEHLQTILPSELSPWDPSIRSVPSAFGFATLKPVEVQSIEDIKLKHSHLRIFTPNTDPPEAGWPVFLWFHGGGWTLGNIDSDNAFCSHMCNGASCITINANYRHAPEDPYPAAVEDAEEALKWIASEGVSKLGLDRNKIAVGGTSAGGNLAAVLSLKAATLAPAIPIRYQFLLLPVIDNTLTEESPHWASKPYAPWLTASRMLWYRNMYLPEKERSLEWQASPNMASSELLARSPRTWIAISEQDLLADEGIAFAQQLKNSGIETQVKIYPGSTHSLLAFSVLRLGKLLVNDVIQAVSTSFA